MNKSSSNKKPYSSACERNQSFILEQLKPLLIKAKNVLEIGSGTGQHAVFFAEALINNNRFTTAI
jgi:predicted O-methyltransferase YrrM